MKPHILPAIRNMKDMEKFVQTDYRSCVLLDTHIGHLNGIFNYLKKEQIETFIHIDLIKGMSHDEFACEYIIQNYKPKGIISTKTKVIKRAKDLDTVTVLRVFIIDSHALERSIQLIQRTQPDYVEVLPGVASKAIQQIKEATQIPVIAGGLISDEAEIDTAVDYGAHLVTTSKRALW
ncbi:glycerol uptake operon antiterminator [Staphylococcus auricularis]|uniref:Glycerol uptake operon antiterminator regulatory protein n=1 Tax=Staphylococcus auricularis TaxID=29379 RepID=A0AAP8PR24_9STAP|nr:glycerol-3-phosphate responsive antiterminator [Staphylococcus auricularis]MBM0867758.1 glycerol-3-phosphate responsive antiterminator [Staphylococcus auricularis]MCE5037946.1 glycerol-3-phosphate responsive antiterminator [Staphylococcus auricularis]MCG7340622.1 glycerol-3-phosphate responsive antiterminator [Staphylococcus auricularis]MDC6326575.1 glycerol-3-phosphate responsive antiterminator [Staphylococcus auricularis]MDN4532452.1 glycerol-3-phosphate responsive antiterminator [Staphyl